MSFPEIFRIYIADQKTLFNGLLPPPEVGGELVFDHEIPDPLQGRLFFRLVGQPEHTADSFLWEAGNTLWRTDQTQKSAFSRTWASSPTNKVCTTAAVWITDLKPFR